MTILEKYVYDTLLDVEAEKAKWNIEPIHTLVRGNNLLQKVQELLGMYVAPKELDAALVSMATEGYIKMGETINDVYAEVVHKEFRSLL